MQLGLGIKIRDVYTLRDDCWFVGGYTTDRQSRSIYTLERVGLGLVVGLQFMVRIQGLGFRVKCLGFTMLDFRV